VQARDSKLDRLHHPEVGPAPRRPGGVRGPLPPSVPVRPATAQERGYRPYGRVARPLTAPLPVITHGEQNQSGRFAGYPAMPAIRSGFGLPNLRRNVCPHFYMTGSRGAIPIQAPHLLKALIRQEQNVSRCQLRGGVHLEQGYVNDVCLTPRFNQCVFYEDELTKD
jgi:hypothetical protein